jgi:uncharacterized protein YbjT (DUF2867 family)
VVGELLRSGASVRALARSPAKADLPAEVEIVGGDLTAPESLDAALAGAGAVFLLWTAPPDTAAAVIDRIGARASRVVLLSSPHNVPHPFFQQPNRMAVFHAELDRRIAGSGIPFTILRPGMFAANTRDWWAATIRAGEPVRWPYGAAETAPIDERDIAAVAARALTGGGHAGREYVLTGPESLSQARQVETIGQVIGRDVRFEELTPDEFRRATAGAWPAPAVEMLLNAWSATIGHRAYVTSTVAEVTGSPARTFGQWAADHAGAFR